MPATVISCEGMSNVSISCKFRSQVDLSIDKLHHISCLPTQCPKRLSPFPSSIVLTTTALRPAKRPASMITTLPLLKLY
jgi:hypothetical protein